MISGFCPSISTLSCSIFCESECPLFPCSRVIMRKNHTTDLVICSQVRVFLLSKQHAAPQSQPLSWRPTWAKFTDHVLKESWIGQIILTLLPSWMMCAQFSIAVLMVQTRPEVDWCSRNLEMSFTFILIASSWWQVDGASLFCRCDCFYSPFFSYKTEIWQLQNGWSKWNVHRPNVVIIFGHLSMQRDSPLRSRSQVFIGAWTRA